MNNKTCGDCKYFVLNGSGYCRNNDGQEDSGNDACSFFAPKVITNGDKIRQMSNEELVMILTDDGCKHCIYRVANSKGFTVTCRYPDKTRIPDCNDGTLAWLNAPAKARGEDE